MTGPTEAFSRVQIDVLLKDAGGTLTDGVSGYCQVEGGGRF